MVYDEQGILNEEVDRKPLFAVRQDGAWHEYPLEIPAGSINALRLDPAKGHVKF